VGVAHKLKWKRSIHTLKYLHEELKLVKEVNQETAPDFEIYYHQYCAKNDIDVKKLNKEHRERIKDVYNVKDVSSFEAPPPDVTGSLSIYMDTDDNLDNEYQSTQDDLGVREAFTKLYKKLAMILHPDKIDASLPHKEYYEKIGSFKKINAAFEKRQYFVLLEYADRYNIATPKNYAQQIRWMKMESEKLYQEVAHEKRTFNYLFGECETDNEKDQVIKSFMNQLFGLVLI